MNITRITIYFSVAFLIVTLPLSMTWGHEVVGEVTPLMLHTSRILTFIKKGRGEEALRMVKRIYENFEVPNRIGRKDGLKINSLRVDQVYGTKSFDLIADSIKEKDISGLQKGIELLGFLLMVEKFDVLHSTFPRGDVNSKVQISIFWSGRNYFSYLLEPTMGEGDPVEEKSLDRLLDQMLYSLEDQEWERFLELRETLTWTIVRFFDFPIPTENFNALK